MIDVIIAFLAAECAPALVLLLKMRQVGLQGDAGVVAALTALGPGGVLGGLGCLLAVQLLAVPAAMACILVYYHWKYRKVYDSPRPTAKRWRPSRGCGSRAPCGAWSTTT